MLSASEQGLKDPMHGNEHGNSVLTDKWTVIKLREMGREIEISPGTGR
jgi:hypothetical protein